MGQRVANVSVLVASLAVATSGCYHITREVRTADLGPTTEVVPPTLAHSPLKGEWRAQDGILRGHVAWETHCVRTEMKLVREEIVKHFTSDRLGNALAIAGSIGIGVAGGALLGHLDSFSDSEASCSQDEIDRNECTTPQEAMGAFGIILLLGGLVGAGAAASSLGDNPRDEVTPTGPVERVDIHRLEGDVACGDGSLADVGLAVRRLDQTVARSNPNEDGDVAFALPEGLSGDLMIVVDVVPLTQASRLSTGNAVGTFHVGPVAEPLPSAAPAPASTP